MGKVTLLESEPGVGKSTLTFELAARVSRGAPMPLEKTHGDPANVILFSADDGLADTIRPRLEAAGAELTRIYAIDREIHKDDVAQFQPTLIIIDPLDSYLCLACERNPVEVMRQLALLARDTGAAVLAVQGATEGVGEDEPLVYHGTPRTVLHLTTVGVGGRRLSVAKSNLRHLPDIHPLVYYIDHEEGQVRIVNWSDGR